MTGLAIFQGPVVRHRQNESRLNPEPLTLNPKPLDLMLTPCLGGLSKYSYNFYAI